MGITGFFGPLEQFEWKNRIILIFAVDPNYEDFLLQERLFKESNEEFEDRDLIVFHIFRNHGLDPDGRALSKEDQLYLQSRYNADPGKYSLILLGKDGGVKLRSTLPVTAEEIYSLIDSMPMRKVEMQRRDGGS